MRWPALLLGVSVFASACASKGDFQTVSGDVAALRQRDAARDSLQQEELARIIAISHSVSAMSDSLRTMSNRLLSAKTMTDTELSTLKEEIARLQDVTGQSEQHLMELRAAMEGSRATLPAIADSTAAAAGPGPVQLLQLGRDQMAKRSYPAARSAFEDLVSRYPTADVVPDALYEIAQSYDAEKNLRAADSAYAKVVSLFPASPRAPTALYKRALVLQALKRTAESRKLLVQLRTTYPRSTEAALARERLR
jgi:tol-pal system protein YbgF